MRDRRTRAAAVTARRPAHRLFHPRGGGQDPGSPGDRVHGSAAQLLGVETGHPRSPAAQQALVLRFTPAGPERDLVVAALRRLVPALAAGRRRHVRSAVARQFPPERADGGPTLAALLGYCLGRADEVLGRPGRDAGALVARFGDHLPAPGEPGADVCVVVVALARRHHAFDHLPEVAGIFSAEELALGCLHVLTMASLARRDLDPAGGMAAAVDAVVA